MTELLGRMKKEKPLSVQDLRFEVNALKAELVKLQRRIKVIELGNLENQLEESSEHLKLFQNS